MEVPVRTIDHHSFVVQIGFFFGVGTSIKYKIKYCYATDVRMRRIRGPPSQKIGKKKKCLNLKIKDPESSAAKIMVEYNSRIVSPVHMQISAP